MSEEKPKEKKIRVMPQDDPSIRGAIMERLNTDSVTKSKETKEIKDEK